MADRCMGSMGVLVKKGESIDKALRRFKKKVDSSKVLREYKERQEFVSPSVKKKQQKKKAIRRQKLLDAENNTM